jgi:sugar/nucleoside kinase (ribokinase family)
MYSKNKDHISFFFAGHFAIDEIIRFKKESKPSLGGSVSFCSLALRTYTEDVDIGIISNIGRKNFDNSLLDLIRNKNIDLKGIKYSSVNNTNFVLDYFNHSRTLTLKSRSPNLTFEDIPREYFDNPPDVFVLVPLCNEISLEYVTQILKQFPDSYIGIDLQGFIRNIKNGKVSYVPDDKLISNMKKVIDLIGDRLILKGSEEEMKLLAGEYEDLTKIMNQFNDYENNAIYIMTLGEKGSMLAKSGQKILKIPAFQSNGVLDETGAGDVYLSIFLYELIQSKKDWDSVEKAAYLASAAASFLVEKNGPAGFETKEKVLARVKSKKYIIS